MNLSKRVKEVHAKTDTMQSDMNDVKSDMFSLTSVMAQSIAPKKL
jgi:hypothetical protein